jgi:Domain of unknown function (DUF4398)
MNRIIPAVALVAATVALGCGSTLPEARIASTETAVQTARASGAADRNSQASQHLKMAEDELAQAKALNGERKGDEADALLRRSEADAAYAAALSDEAKQKAWAGHQ